MQMYWQQYAVSLGIRVFCENNPLLVITSLKRQSHIVPFVFFRSSILLWRIHLFSSPEPKAQVSYCHSASSVGLSSGVIFHIFDLSETTERNWTKLDRKQDLNVLYQVCVFRADPKNKMAAWPLIGWAIFDFSSETAERNSTKLDRKQ